MVPHRLAGHRALDRGRVPRRGRSGRGWGQRVAASSGARRARGREVCRVARRRLADDRQRIGVLPNLPRPRKRGGGDARPRVLDRGRVGDGALGMRRTEAVWAGKATGALSRLSGRGGGTTLPGDVARAIDPAVLRKLTADLTEGSIVITGTNGKTTTARLLASLFEGLGKRVVANRAGANLIFGATAAALPSAGPDGRLRAEWGVFEIDEASLPRAIDEIQPRAAIVLNLFRDQLDRYGELEKIARTIESALGRLPEGAQAILNADDPRVGEIGLGLARKPIWFGLDEPPVAMQGRPRPADAGT